MMGGLFQGITNLAGGLLGETDAQYQQKNSQNQANTYGNQAATGYQTMQGNGYLQQQPGNANLQNLYAQFANQNGANYMTPFGNSTPTGSSAAPAGTYDLNTAAAGRNNVANLFSSLAGFGASDRGNYAGQIGGAQNNYLNAANLGGSGTSPYALNQNQQRELNGQLDQVSQAHQAAQQQLQQTFARSGLLSSPGAMAAGQAQLAEHFGSLHQQTAAQFTENARQQQVQQSQAYLQYLQGLQGAAAAETGAGASGLESVAGASQSAGQFGVNNANAQQAQHNAALLDLLSHLEGQNQAGANTYAQGTSGLAGLGGAAQGNANIYNNQQRQDLSGLLALGLTLGGVGG